MGAAVDIAQFLKIDFRLMDQCAREQLTKKYAGRGIALLAEKVETRKQMEEARKLGFHYFQGHFFCKPAMMETRDISGNKLIHLKLLTAVARLELDYEEIEALLNQDPSLLYRLLRLSEFTCAGAALGSEEYSPHHCFVGGN